MSDINIKKYTQEDYKIWDDFINNQSINGTFLHTKNFLNYHKEGRFIEASILIYIKNILVAVVPACEIYEDGKKIFFSHKGSTFGGIIINKKIYNITTISKLIEAIENYLALQGYSKIIYKNVSNIFNENKINLLNYLLYKNQYNNYQELGFVINYQNYNNHIISNFDNQRKRSTKKALKNDLLFKKLYSNLEVKEFYEILKDNLKKFDSNPVHSLEEILEFKNERLKEIVEFYGVFNEGKIIAGTMIFNFNNKILHAQYLAVDQNSLKLYPMNYLYYKLIEIAYKNKYEYLSWGIATENNGLVLNEGLASFKEGFGSEYSINMTYYKELR